MPGHRHSGIPCTIESQSICFAIEHVLRRVDRCFPKDFTRLLARVTAFARLDSPNPALFGRFRTGGNDDLVSAGVVELREHADHPVAVVAHELGHACVRQRDFSRRAKFDAQWAEEMAADQYVRKWGFGRHLARAAPRRSVTHHGPQPGQDITFGPDEQGHIERYRVSRRSCIHLVQIETGDGTIIETGAERATRIWAECVLAANRVGGTADGQNVNVSSLYYVRMQGQWIQWRRGENQASLSDRMDRRKRQLGVPAQEDLPLELPVDDHDKP